ncbi:class I SAM-dependent methyltransferase [Scytonema hofmannii FACHB-248]|uniref:Class I SAM-dependent methyltransferase n=1 Tax=Scytonema hofmannii FACHB-248 TaxID=1842502 RepID=A0ABR8H1L8_9CYAN|nr:MULTISPECIES: class I SAM-dependent methyltransferase [Nostocales]MBD2609237.1 class I SAM-dependent methyltransferase [Scytonema hofmannii FACHB-248]
MGTTEEGYSLFNFVTEKQKLCPNQLSEKLVERLPATSMPDTDWWEDLWPQPEKTLKDMGLQSGMSVLDFGCGYGHFTIPAAQLVNPSLVVGIDIDLPILLQAQKKQFALELSNCIFLYQDFLSIPNLIANKFDYIIIHSTFHGLPKPVKFVKQIIHLLKIKGYISVVNWQPISREQTIWKGKPRGPKTELRIAPQQLLSTMQAANERLIPVQYVELPPYHYGITFQLTGLKQKIK